jgi:hypothetical protein
MFLFKVNSSKRRAECRECSSRVNSLRSGEEAAQLIVIVPALGTVSVPHPKLISIAIFRDIFNVERGSLNHPERAFRRALLRCTYACIPQLFSCYPFYLSQREVLVPKDDEAISAACFMAPMQAIYAGGKKRESGGDERASERRSSKKSVQTRKIYQKQYWH